MSKRTVTGELQTPPRAIEAGDKVNIYLPAECSRAAADLLGEGFGKARVADGMRKYFQLRQMLLDEQVQAMAKRLRFKVVGSKNVHKRAV
jgi:hypothetical protein